MGKYRPSIRVLVSAGAAGEQEWNRYMQTRREIAALRAWDLPAAQCAELLRAERKRHKAQVKANYELYQHVLVERYAERAKVAAREDLTMENIYQRDLYFGYREERRNKVLALREALAQGKISYKVYERLENEAKMYCNAMIKHARKVKALEERLPPRPYVRKREQRNPTR